MQLEGNNLKEWIAALEPVDPEQFKTMEKGTKIIHITSSTMQPDEFVNYEAETELHPALVEYNPASSPDSLNSYGVTGWFFFPEPAVEQTGLEPAREKGKVKELGGKWKDAKVEV